MEPRQVVPAVVPHIPSVETFLVAVEAAPVDVLVPVG